MTQRLTPSETWLGDSPRANVIKVSLVVLGVEFAIMAFIEGVFEPLFGKDVSPLFWEFIDPILLTIIVAPILNIWVLRPMREQEKELRVAAVAFESQNGMVITDSRGLILRVNPAFVRMTGYKPEEVVGKTPAVLKSGRQDPTFYQSMWGELKERGYWYGEIWNRRKNGQIYPELLTITAVTDPDGSVIHYVGDFCEISESQVNEVEIRRLAYFDPLTNLPNRQLLEVLITQALLSAKRSKAHGAILAIRLTRIELFGSSPNHEQWDHLLIEIAHCIRSTVRGNDTVARCDTDEFVVLLEDLDNQESAAGVLVEQVAQKLHLAIEALLGLSGNENSCNLSIGSTTFSHSDSAEGLIAKAASAVRKGNEAGNGTPRSTSPTTDDL